MNGLSQFINTFFSKLHEHTILFRFPVTRMKLARVFAEITMAAAVMGFVGTGSASAQAFTDTSLGFIQVGGDAAVAWGDYDSDGDLDVFISGKTNPSSYALAIYRNDGASWTNIGASIPAVGQASMDWGDYDNDGDLDIILTGYTGAVSITRIYRNDVGVFNDISAGLPGMIDGDAKWGDYDNDGDLDFLLVGNAIASIYRNDGGDTFVNISASLTTVQWGDGAWGDYDNDGDLDIVYSGYNGGSITKVYRNDGAVFTDIGGHGIDGAEQAGSIAWGDYDMDGYLDILITGHNGTSPIAKIYRNQSGAGTFSQAANLTGMVDSDGAWGDFDNDGDLDVLISGASTITRLYRNDGAAFVDTTGSIIQIGYGGISWGDFDNDNDLDILLTGWDGGANGVTKVYRNNVQVSNTLPFTPIGLSHQIIGSDVALSWDQAGDGQTGNLGLTYNLRIGTTPGGSDIKAPMAALAGGIRRIAQIGNVHHDTVWTLKNVANGTYYWSVQSIDNSFAGSNFSGEQSFSYPPPDTFAVSSVSPTQNAIHVSPISDITIKFPQDVLVDSLNSRTIRVFGSQTGPVNASYGYLDSTATVNPFNDLIPGEVVTVTLTRGILATDADTLSPFVWQFHVGSGASLASFIPVDTLNVGTNPSYMTSADLNGDGNVDIVTSNQSSNNVSIALNDGSGHFNSPTNVAVGNLPYEVVAADFDGDGDIDLAVASNSGQVISILLNDGAGNFSPGTDFSAGSAQLALTAADFDGDGDIDLISSESGTSVRVRLNNGVGVFSSGNTITTENNPYFITSADVDNDGDIDLIAVNYSSGTFSVRFNDGGANFSGAANYTTSGVQPRTVRCADFNSDGFVDLVVTNENSGHVAIRLNDGFGVFSGNEITVGSLPEALALGDFEGDGDMDVIVTNYGSTTVQQVTNNGSGTFSPGPTFGLTNGGWTITTADYNADGSMDVAVTDNSTNQVIILQNNPVVPTTTIVTTKADGGNGSLRNAIDYANSHAGPDTIIFNVSVDSVLLASQLPDITDDSLFINGDFNSDNIPDVVIDGVNNGVNESFARVAANDVTIKGLMIIRFVQGSEAALTIANTARRAKILYNYVGTDGTALYGNVTNIDISAPAGGGQHEIRGNVISARGYGIQFYGATLDLDTTLIADNKIGTNAAGSAALTYSPSHLSGIYIQNGRGLKIHSNIISGWSGAGALAINFGYSGFSYYAKEVEIFDNKIGTDFSGTAAIPNERGIYFDAGSNRNFIGKPGLGNIISGNTGNGIELWSDSNFVEDNLIGVDLTGNTALANAGMGIQLQNASVNTIGNTNTISGNANHGIFIFSNGGLADENTIINNNIGVGADGVTPVGNNQMGVRIYSLLGARRNLLLDNVIAFNNFHGLEMDGSSSADSMIAHGNRIYRNNLGGMNYVAGSNGSIISPIISFMGSDSVVHGTSDPNAFVQIYVDSTNQGRLRIGTGTADGSGNFAVPVTLLGGEAPFLTALQSSAGRTSGFSAPINLTFSDPSIVNSTADDGLLGTLRFAINYANSNPGPDTIRFDISLLGQTINMNSNLPDITDDYTVINGDVDGDNIGDVQLYGFNPTADKGLNILSSYNEIRNLRISNFFNNASGIDIDGGNYNIITGCYVDDNEVGIHILNGGKGNRIGDGTISGRNYIFNNTYNASPGIIIEHVGTDSNIVAGNFIGTEDGVTGSGNGSDGVIIRLGAKYNKIGDANAQIYNVISANTNNGILIESDSNMVVRNLIGTDSTGTQPLGNQDYGIHILNAVGNMIGDGTPAGRNILADNSNNILSGAAIMIDASHNNFVLGNFIGTDVTGINPLTNRAGGGDGAGVILDNGSTGNMIGDGTVGGRNVFGANGSGGDFQNSIVLFNGSNYNIIAGNFMATDSTGLTGLGSPDRGIGIFSSIGNQIGAYGAPQVIGGIGGNAVELWTSDSTLIVNNYVGLGVDGATALSNTGVGIVLISTSLNTRIGDGTVGGRNFIANNGNSGIAIDPTSQFTEIAGNYIGTDSSGTVASPNMYGVYTQAKYTKVGNGTIGGRNVISGNTIGINFDSVDSSQVNGNYVGLDPTGTTAVANATGILIIGSGNVIGGPFPGTDNVISGNSGDGIRIDGGTSRANFVFGNIIGLGADGIASIANNAGIRIQGGAMYTFVGAPFGNRSVISGNATNGIVITGSDSNYIVSSRIGTDTSGSIARPNGNDGIRIDGGSGNQVGDFDLGNLISGNGVNGVTVTSNASSAVGNIIAYNMIGVAADSTGQMPNGTDGVLIIGGSTFISGTRVEYNRIAHNVVAGITADGTLFQVDNGHFFANEIYDNGGIGIALIGNAHQNVWAPVITSVDLDSTVTGYAGQNALVQLFADSANQGRIFLDSAYANSSGFWSMKVAPIPSMNYTAIQDSFFHSSSFSAPVPAMAADPLIVTSTADDSTVGTLRRAIGFANSQLGRNLITFSLSVNDTIHVNLPMPNITDTLEIDGGGTNVTIAAMPSFSGFALFNLRAPFSQLRNFNMFGRGIAQRGIFLDNAGAGGNDSKLDNVDALEFTVAGIQGDAVRDTIINSHVAGNGTAGINPGIWWVISNNVIGTDAGGGVAYGIPQGIGIWINVYGGIQIDQNLISGHSVAGIQIVESNNNVIFNNGIGTDVSATVAIPNDYGIVIDSLSMYNQIGLPGGGNVISGNTNFAISIQNNGADSNYVLANKIGTDITGTVALGNAIGVATQLTTGPNFIGDGTPSGRNIISANSGHGLYLFGPDVADNNFIGTDATGTADLGNVAFGVYMYGANTRITNNVISGNDNAGVYIAGTTGHIVTGNFIGTDSTGNVALPNLAGITLTNIAYGSTIGGMTPAERNVISGNTNSGLRIENGAGNITAIGNYIGLSADGLNDLGNGSNGVEIDDASGNQIGNGTLNGRNFISGNDNWGVDIQFLADSNSVMGNVIGTDTSGTNAVGYSIVGVNVSGPFNKVGGYQAGQGNVIGGGIGYTVSLGNSTDNLIAGNFMGVTPSGTPISGSSSGFYITGNSRRDSLVDNTIAYLLSSPLVIQDAPTDSITFFGNKIHHNAGDFNINATAQFGVAPPRITLVLPDSTVMGNAAPNALVQIFADSSNDGQIFVDTTYANGSGLWAKKVPLYAGMSVTAMQDSLGNTSNFSAPFIPSFVPSVPTGLFAIAQNGQVELKWNANYDGLTTKYRIYYDMTALPTTLQDSTTGGATDTTKTITGLTNGQIYYFRVSALNVIEQESGFSNEDAAVPVGEAGNALAMNGVNQLVNGGTGLGLNLSVGTWEAWARIDNLSHYNRLIIKQDAGDAGTYELFYDMTTQSFRAEVVAGSIRYGVSSAPGSVQAGIWYHVAASYDGNDLNLYVNGSLAANALIGAGSIDNNTGPLGIGGNASGVFDNTSALEGQIDEVRIWNVVRSPLEIASARLGPLRGDETGLTGLFHFDESIGTTAFDGSINGYDGTVINGAANVTSGAMAPFIPQSLTATPFVPDSIVVSWNSNQESDLSHYIVYRSTTNGFIPAPSDSIGQVAKPDTMFTDLTAQIGNSYYYRVSGVDSSNQIGQYSNQVAGAFPVGILSASIPAINFGNVSLGNNAVIQTKVFVNGGWAEITGSSFDLGTDFSLATPLTLPDTIIAGDTVLVDVRFTPSAFSALTDTLRLSNNTSVNPLIIVLDGNGVSGMIASNVNPATYGNVAVGSNATQTIKVYSNGGAVEVSGAAILSGTDFTITNALTLPDTLFANDTLSIDVQFAPTAFSSLTDTLVVNNNSGVPVFKVALDGTGIPGTIATLLNPVNYGTVSVGNNATQTVKVFSNGGAVEISSATIAAGIDFTITNGLSFPDTLFANDTLSVDVQFAPTAFSALTDTLVINNNSGTPVFKIALNGTGVAGTIVVLPSSVNFGTVAADDSSASMELKIHSSGGAVNLSPLPSLEFGTAFEIDSISGPALLSTGDTLRVYLKYHATTFGAQSDSLIINNNSATPLVKAALDGVGEAGTLASMNNSYDFGDVNVGNSDTVTVKLFVPNSAVRVSGLTLTSGTHFSILNAPGLPDTLHALNNDTLVFQLKFQPLVVSRLSDTLLVANNSSLGTLRINLDGNSLISPVTPVTVSLYPEADAQVSANNPGINYGSSNRVYIFGNALGDEHHGYFRFDLGAIPVQADVSAVQFRITASDGFAYNYYPNDDLYFVSDDSWNEASINWGSRPAFAQPYLGTWFSWMNGAYDATFSTTSGVLRDSVQNQLRSDGKISFNVSNGISGGGYYNNYYSREGAPDNARRPQLLVTYLPATLATLTPTVLFGNVQVGDSATQVVKVFTLAGSVSNTGTSYQFGTDYMATVIGGLPRTLQNVAGDTMLISITFKPTSFGPHNDSLFLANSSLVNPFGFALQGTGVPGTLSVNPAVSVNFGNVAVQDSAQNVITVYPVGGAVQISGSNLLSGTVGIKIDSVTGPSLLLLGDTMKIYVTYKPFIFGAITDSLFIDNNSVIPSVHLGLDGTGISGSIASNVNPASYGNVSLGNNATQTIKVYSIGGAVEVSSATILSGTDFTITNALTLPDTLFANDTLSIDVQFAPTAFSSLTDTLVVNNNSGVPVFKIALDGMGLSGNIASNVNPASYGNVSLGNNATQTIKVYSTGGAVEVSAAAIAGGTDFTITNALTLPDTLFANDTLLVDVQFAPTAFSSLTDTLVVNNNSGVLVFKIALDGTGIPGSIATLNNPETYGNVAVGSNATQTIKVYSIGGAVEVSSATILSGTDFTITNALTLPDTLFANDTLSIDVQFAPTAFSSLTDTLVVNNNSGTPVFKIVLDGTGIPGSIATLNNPETYGNVAVGGNSTQTIKVYSTGGAVEVSAAAITGGTDFTITNALTLPDTLFANDTLSIDVQFAPTAFSSLTDTLVVNNNSGVLVFKIALDGTGIPGSIATLNNPETYGNVAVGSNATQTIKVYSTGGAVEVSAAAIAGGTDFTITNALTLPDTLFANDTLLVDVQFAPTAFSSLTDTLVVNNNSGVAVFKIALNGTGIPGTLAASPSAFSFGNLETGDSLQTAIKIYSVGGAVSWSAANLFDGTQFSVVSTTGPSILFDGDTLSVNVRFKPLTIGLKNDTLQITNNSAITPLKVALSGSGSLGSLFVSTNTLLFGSVQIGDSAQQSVKIYGTSNGITVSNATLNVGSHFVVIPGQALPVTLNLGDTLNATIRFKPQTFGSIVDTAQIINISVNNPLSISLSGAGAIGTLAPLSANFGLVTIGDSATQVLKLYTGSGAVIVDSLKFDFGTEFNFTSLGAFPDTVFPGDTLLMSVKYKPVVFATTSDTIRVYNNSSQALFPVSLNGIGNSGTLVVVPASANFGNVMVGDSAVQRLKLYASGANIIVSSGALEIGGDYSIVSTSGLPVTLVAGVDTLTVDVKFKPSTFGSLSDRLIVTNNSLLNPVKVNVTGNGAAGTLAASPFGYSFGNVAVNSSAQQSVKIYAATGKVIVTNLGLDNSSAFMLTSGNLPDTLSSGDTLVALITFSPTVTGTLSDTLRIGNNSQTSSIGIGLDGTGEAGALASDVAAFDFGNIKVGNNSERTFKFYTSTGQVIINGLALGVSGQYTLSYSAVLPVTLNAGDTLLASVRFTPTTGGTDLDTLYVMNNSAASIYGVDLTGFGVVNSAPNVFALKQPGNDTIVNTKTPVFTWEGRGDVDGDALSYTLQISKSSSFSSVTQFGGITDTMFTLTSPLDSAGNYFWRVSANDNEGGITLSNAESFTVDAVNPGLFVGVLASTIQQNYIEVYVHSDEALNSLNGIFILRDASNTVVDTDTLAIANLSGLLYYVPYKLSFDGELTMTITGVDAVGNSTTSEQVYDILAVSAKASIALHTSGDVITITGSKGSVDRSGYLIVMSKSTQVEISESLAKAIDRQNELPQALLSETVSPWTPVGETVKILSTVEIKKTLTVTMKYDQGMIRGLMDRYPGFSESKIGMYREEDSRWIYEGGEGERGQVSAKVKTLGVIGLFYNPEHVDLPKSIELSQNYPNPFNPSTSIRFGLPDEGKVKLVIYNVLGQKVRELINESRPAGYHTAVWNGKNDLGQEVASGLYIYRIESVRGAVSKKMLLIK